MTRSATFPTRRTSLDTAYSQQKWRWIVALGALFIVGGLVALFNVMAATVVATVYVAAAMMVAGAWQIVTALQIRPWSRAALWCVVGALTLLAGLAAARFPIPAAVSFTVLIGALLITGGAIKLALAYKLSDLGRWEYIAIAGGLGLVIGLLILAELPTSGLFVLGLLLGVNLLFEGIGWLAMGLGARGAVQRSSRPPM